MNTTSPFFNLWFNGMGVMAIIGVVACGGAFYVFRRKSAVPWLLIALFLAIILWIATLPLYSPGFRGIIADRRNDGNGIESPCDAAPSTAPLIQATKNGLQVKQIMKQKAAEISAGCASPLAITSWT